MVAAWSIGQPAKRFEPWACANCARGRMTWFACNLTDDRLRLEHKFACDYCGDSEHVMLPFTPLPAPEVA